MHLFSLGYALRPAWIRGGLGPLALQAFLSTVLVVFLSLSAHAVPTIDEPAPPLKGILFDGTPFDLTDYKGKVVMVNFFSSFCKFCAYEIGNVENYYEEFKPKGLEVIALSIDHADDKERSARMAKNYNLPGGMVTDLSESGFEKKYPTPTCYVFDRKGVLRAKFTGAKQPKFYREIIEPLLKE
jgi:cytochrome c biogenesis protein CcmG, thiol:disulfide interchange protein DsbE